MWAKFASAILRNRIIIIITILAITIFMGFMGRKVELSYKMTPLLPKTDSSVIEYKEYQKQFGEDGSLLVIGVEDSRLFKLEAFNKWYDLTNSLKKIRVEKLKGKERDTVFGVTESVSIASVYNLVKAPDEKKFILENIFQKNPTSQEELDSLLQIVFSLPFYQDFIYTKDTTTLLALTLDKEIIDSEARHELMEAILSQTKKFEEETNIKLHYSGLPYIRYNNTTEVSAEIKLFIILSALITTIILFIFFRSIKATFFSLIVVGIGVIWSNGIVGICGYDITILTALIPPLVIVIGIPNSVFLLNKYHREFSKHGNQIKSLQRVIERIGNATFLTNFTTSLGFATFIFTQSQGLVEFGVVASLSVMSIFLLSITLIPIIFSFLSEPKVKHTKHLENKWMGIIVDSLVRVVSKRRTIVYSIAIIVFGISIWGITTIKTTGNLVDDLPKDDPITIDLKEFFEVKFQGVLPLEILIDTKKKGGVMQLSNLQKIDELQTVLHEHDRISKAVSIVDGLKFTRQAYYNGNPQKYALLNEQEKSFLAPYLKNAGDNKGLLKAFVDSLNQTARVSAQIADIGTEEMEALMNELNKEIDAIFPPEDYNVIVTGSSTVFLKGTSYLVKNLFISLLIAITLIAIIMALLFSSLRMILISLVPNLLPLVITGGLMGILGVAIKPSTILVFSIAFGISVDDTIHYLAKYRQELKIRPWDIRTSVLLALKETGMSMIYTSVILFFGFGVFTASKFGGTIALGFLVSTTLLFAMLSNLVLLPSLLLTLEKRILSRAFKKEPLIELVDEEEDIDLDFLQINNGNNENGAEDSAKEEIKTTPKE